MLAAIEAARDQIFLEVYRFARARVGSLFSEALASAARRGVQVRVVLDGWGSAPHAGEVARVPPRRGLLRWLEDLAGAAAVAASRLMSWLINRR
jgi:phosphatidylserine/phosphatidylglycerophosphate/cardiolipin synthase-like enzyme